ncbi:MAG: PD-(D/E)XK nuclease family transposase [Fibrobacter sp.]|nr:PD-(D/E)XK nuclease family transposase [Fibrobacter sp.]
MIKELRFRFEKPIEFRVPQRKKVIFDIFAMTGSGRFLNIEMQRLEHDYFIDRTILYKAFLVIKGRKEMEESAEFKALQKYEQEKRRYQLPEGISVWICDFDLPDAKGEHWDEWALYSKHAVRNGMAVPLSKKNKYIFLSVPNFTKSADEVKGSAEVWLYLLNHARDGGELPDFGSDIVEEALDRIRVENADDKLLEAQEHDMTTKEDYECWAAGKIIAAEARGEAKGESKGHADAIDVFQELGASPEMIAEAKARLAAKSSSEQK